MSGQSWVKCPGTGQPAARIVSDPVRAAEPEPQGPPKAWRHGQGPRQHLTAYGRGVCPSCGQTRAVNLQRLMRSHTAEQVIEP